MAVSNFDLTIDYYLILGLNREALRRKSEEEIQQTIKTAYRRLAMVHHPDKKTGNTAEMQKLVEAYTVLSDPLRRKKYDSVREHDEAKMASTASFFHTPFNNRQANIPKPTPGQRVYEAISPLADIQRTFEQFAKQLCATNEFINEKGFSARLECDPTTGQQILHLTFPDQQSADRFIAQLLRSGMIKNPLPQQDIAKAEQYDGASPYRSTQTPFNLFAQQRRPLPTAANRLLPEEEQQPTQRRGCGR